MLTDRVTRLLLAGVKPERILCLTFTKAAAAEMRNRLADQLGRWALADEATLDKEIAKLIDRRAGGRASASSRAACSPACSTRRAASTSSPSTPSARRC